MTEKRFHPFAVLHLLRKTILVCITRDAEFIIPHGNTTLLPWDRILCLTQDDTLHLLMDAWGLSGK